MAADFLQRKFLLSQVGSGGGMATGSPVSGATANAILYSDASSNLATSVDADTGATIGRFRVGSPTTDEMTISHYDQMSSTGFAIKQSATGITTLNSVGGNNINITSGGSLRWYFASGSHFVTGNTNGYDIGQATTNHPRTLYLGTSIRMQGAGTAGSPSIRMDETSATGFYYNASHQIGFSCNGTEYMRLGSGGITLVPNITMAANAQLQSSSGSLTLSSGSTAGSIQLNIGGSGVLEYIRGNQTSGTNGTFTYTGATHTGLTLSTEVADWKYTMPTMQWATGAITTQRFMQITSPTSSFVGASTITDAVTLSVAGPTAGTNATHTRSWAQWWTGHIGMSADNTYDIGQSGFNRPRNIYLAGNLSVAGSIQTSGNTWLAHVGTPNRTQLSGFSSGYAVELRGFQTGGETTNADVRVNTVNTRTAGNLFEILNNGTSKMTVNFDGKIGYISGNSQTTVGAGGAASALPANPTGYIMVFVGGTEYVVPYYAKS
jgi:hypothetical protein